MTERGMGWIRGALCLLAAALLGGATHAFADPAPTTLAAEPAGASATPPADKSGQGTGDSLSRMPSAAAMRPTGPVTVTARRAELVQGSSAIYVGNVVLESDTLHLDGDRLELQQFGSGQYTAKVTGTPGHMSHAGNGPDNPPVSAHAKQMNYDSRTGLLDLLGDAFFKRSDDQITGDTIHYNVIERRVEASGSGETGQVKIIIQPPPPDAGAPAAPGPAP